MLELLNSASKTFEQPLRLLQRLSLPNTKTTPPSSLPYLKQLYPKATLTINTTSKNQHSKNQHSK